MDGWITVGTKLDTKDLEKDIKTAENKMKQYEKEAQKLAQQKAKVNLDLSAYEEEKRKIKEVTDLILKQTQTEEQVNEVLSIENIEIEKLNQKYSEAFSKNETIEKAISENVNQQKILNNEIDEMNEKLNKAKGIGGIRDAINEASTSTTGIIKKVGKWALAIFSVRSAYMMVRSAASTLSEYNTDLANKIETIRVALATSLEPIIVRIVDLIYKLVGYINILTKAWFNLDLFAHAQEKSLAESVAQAKKLRKQLTSFDEMNVLSEDESSNGANNYKFEQPELNPEIVKAFEKFADIIKDNWYWLKELGIMLAGVFALSKVAGWINNIRSLTGSLGEAGLLGALKGIIALGVITIVIETVNIVRQIKEIQDEEEEAANKLEDWNEKGYNILENNRDINESLNSTDAQITAINKKLDMSDTFWGKILLDQDDELRGARAMVSLHEKQLDSQRKSIKNDEYTRQQKSQQLDQWIRIYELSERVNDKLKAQGKLTEEDKNKSKHYAEAILELADNLGISLQNEDRFRASVEGTNDQFYKMKGKIDEINGTKLEDKSATYTINATADTSQASRNLSELFSGLARDVANAANQLTGVFKKKKYAKGGVIYNPIRCAKGSVISQPGRGVPIGYNAIGGEAGREGVIPLTDTQQMSLLGEAIGKYININLTNITKLDNRQIAREQKVINAQNDFAFNK